ncbi:MAG: PH domain-containing protein [Rhodobacteraceae bacterium]|nr:PH domain-containing protein [Paracoccaceae bacterium]
MTPVYSEHPKMFRNHPLIFLIFLALCVIGIGILFLGIWYLSTKSSKLTVTETNLLFEKGLLSKSRSELSLNSIRTVNVSQSFTNRIFGTGTVSIFTAGDNPEIVAKGFPRPHSIRDAIKKSLANGG